MPATRMCYLDPGREPPSASAAMWLNPWQSSSTRVGPAAGRRSAGARASNSTFRSRADRPGTGFVPVPVPAAHEPTDLGQASCPCRQDRRSWPTNRIVWAAGRRSEHGPGDASPREGVDSGQSVDVADALELPDVEAVEADQLAGTPGGPAEPEAVLVDRSLGDQPGRRRGDWPPPGPVAGCAVPVREPSGASGRST